jgi:hypothetical protein
MKDVGGPKIDLLSFAEEIQAENRVVGLVLRGHLRIEAEAERLLHLKCIKPEALKDLRLTAIQKFKLCQGLWGEPEGDGFFWQSLESLNVLRNEIAHGLRKDQLDAKVRKFVSTIEADCANDSGQALEESLLRCLCYLHHDMVMFEQYGSRT